MSLETYRHLLDRALQAYPSLDPTGATVNVDGLVNIAVIIGERVFRFARDEQGERDLTQEIAVLELLRETVQLPVPVFEVIDRDFVSYPLISGEPLFRNTILRLTTKQQDRLAQQLAEFLREMHAIPPQTLQDRNIRQSGGRQTRAEWLELYQAIAQELFPLMYRSTRIWVEAHFAPLMQNDDWLTYQPVLIHDDLAQYHILYDAPGVSISGIIDFGTAGTGDPARDYAALINVYGESFVQRMVQYDERIPALIDRARFYAGTLELQWVLGGVRTGSNDWFTAHLDRARDVQPYGAPI